MRKPKIALLALMIALPGALRAEDTGGQIQALLCHAGTETDTYLFHEDAQGRISLLGEDAATVVPGASSLTILIKDRVLQFNGNRLQSLVNGALDTRSCIDITEDMVELAEFLETAAPATVVAGSIVPDFTPGAILTWGETEAIRMGVNRCWNIDPGSVVGITDITVVFKLDRRGRVGEMWMAGLEPVTDAERVAYEAARRAILRCQGEGYPVPGDRLEEWTEIYMRFSGQDGLTIEK